MSVSHGVYLDQDGVLADFVSGICQAHGRDDPYHHPDSKGVWDIWELWDVPLEEFWRPCEYDFWRNLPKTPEADMLEQVASWAAWMAAYFLKTHVQVRIITMPSENHGCVNGKLDWLDHHYPHLGHEVIFDRDKWKYAKVAQGSLLIDDNANNCDKWERAGGKAILVPRPWNTAWQQAGGVKEVVQNGVGKWLSEIIPTATWGD